MKNKKRLLIIQEEISSYNIPVYELLCEYYEVTLLFSKGKEPQGVSFDVIYVPYFSIHYNIYTRSLRRIAEKFDVVICMASLGFLQFRLLRFEPRKYKLIYWGIGVSADYSTRYDSNPIIVEKWSKIAQKADAMLFYNEYPIKKYIERGVPKEKLFVANNTVRVLEEKSLLKEKNKFIFVGSLYKEKKINCLLDSYLNAYYKNHNIFELLIVGDGAEKENIEAWIKENNLSEKIHLLGAIYEETKLAELFSESILCISPDQAGLSVLKSMGYGVPFVTSKNAITGGEIFNIVNGENGLLLDSLEELSNILLDCVENSEKYSLMGKMAKEYYDKYCTIEKMAEGFINAIDYSIKDR